MSGTHFLTGENLRFVGNGYPIDSTDPKHPVRVWGVNFHHLGSVENGEAVLAGEPLSAQWIEASGDDPGRVYARGWGTLSSWMSVPWGLDPRTGVMVRGDPNLEWHPARGSYPFTWPYRRGVLY